LGATVGRKAEPDCDCDASWKPTIDRPARQRPASMPNGPPSRTGDAAVKETQGRRDGTGYGDRARDRVAEVAGGEGGGGRDAVPEEPDDGDGGGEQDGRVEADAKPHGSRGRLEDRVPQACGCCADACHDQHVPDDCPNVSSERQCPDEHGRRPERDGYRDPLGDELSLGQDNTALLVRADEDDYPDRAQANLLGSVDGQSNAAADQEHRPDGSERRDGTDEQCPRQRERLEVSLQLSHSMPTRLVQSSVAPRAP
jgi:hypothetical protein